MAGKKFSFLLLRSIENGLTVYGLNGLNGLKWFDVAY